MMELSEFAKRLLALAEDLAGAPVRVDVSYTVTAASGTLVEAVAESPELALAQWLVDVLESTEEQKSRGAEGGGERVTAASYAGAMDLRPAAGQNGHGATGTSTSRPTTPEHLERMKGMVGRRNREIAEELGLPESTVAYHMGKIRKSIGSAQDDDGQKRGEGRPDLAEGSPFRG